MDTTTNQLVADLRFLVASVAVWSAGRDLLLLPFLGWRNPEILANLAGEVVGYLGVSGDRGSFAGRWVAVDAMVGPFPAQLAAVGLQVP